MKPPAYAPMAASSMDDTGLIRRSDVPIQAPWAASPTPPSGASSSPSRLSPAETRGSSTATSSSGAAASVTSSSTTGTAHGPQGLSLKRWPRLSPRGSFSPPVRPPYPRDEEDHHHGDRRGVEGDERAAVRQALRPDKGSDQRARPPGGPQGPDYGARWRGLPQLPRPARALGAVRCSVALIATAGPAVSELLGDGVSSAHAGIVGGRLIVVAPAHAGA